MAKQRADILLAEQGIFHSRSAAQRAIMAGLVSDHNHQRIDKSGTKFPEGEKFYVKDDGKKYVSRGGFKLEKALKVFDIDLTNKICLDIGASTGGFTDVALQNGAQMVYALDVGYNQLAWQLRDDPRVVVMEKQNLSLIHISEPTRLLLISYA
ncbi:TlyA family RNA methyltransferase, partial [Lactobacillus crispatus]|uniref:TlyA family RNA methyltransferase n=1 Tax=Lactobacillus crispatus TaxID=47770 RepID=UPI00254619F7